MEFDKSKILTVVTADQAKIGQKGWFASNVETLSRLVLEEQPKELLGVDSNNAVHAFKTVFQNHALFYPAPEPTPVDYIAWLEAKAAAYDRMKRMTREHRAWEMLIRRLNYLNTFGGNRSEMEKTTRIVAEIWDDTGHEEEPVTTLPDGWEEV
jgi:hypothetical protein